MSRPIQSQLSTLNVPGGPPFSLRVPYPSDGRPTELSIPWPLPTPIDKPINFDPDTERPHATVANNGVVSAIGFVESATGSDIFVSDILAFLLTAEWFPWYLEWQ